MMLRSSGWMRCTDQPWAWRSITSSSSAARSAAACASARANSDAFGPQRLRQRPAGQVVLVERDHRGPALVGAAHSRRARDVFAGARVHADALARLDEQRHLDHRAGLERRRLGAAAGDRVAAQARIGLGDLQVDGAGQLQVAGLARR